MARDFISIFSGVFFFVMIIMASVTAQLPAEPRQEQGNFLKFFKDFWDRDFVIGNKWASDKTRIKNKSSRKSVH
ncbi:hypothetical protein MKW92_043195 [Papaver armeniacum]|nr:hypothetical protein MKW92_043195 [Papaver armeniacum]